MYKLLRYTLVATVLLAAYLVAVGVVVFPPLGAAVAAVALYAATRRPTRLTAYGTNRLAVAADIPHLLAGHGVIFGHLDSPVSRRAGLVTLGYTWCWLGFQSALPGRPTTEGSPSPAWTSVQPMVASADRQSVEAVEKRLAEVTEFFERRAAGSDGFAEDVLSLGGKWELLKAKAIGGSGHSDLLAEAFSRRLFTPDELRVPLESAVRGYLADLDAIENELLVALAADLTDGELGRGGSPHPRGGSPLHRAFGRVADSLRPALVRDLGLTAGRELGTTVATELATRLAVRVAASLATEMGISTSVLGSGALAMGASMGLSVVVGLVVDAILDRLLRLCGHDPEAAISQVMRGALKEVEARIIDGNLAAVATHRTLLHLAEYDGMGSVRDAARTAVPQVERGGQLGLRWELTNLHETRLRLRRQALQKLLAGGGA